MVDLGDRGVRQSFKKRYSRMARQFSAAQGGAFHAPGLLPLLGYGQQPEVPPEGWWSLGCGNPVALARLLPGQTVLDLGSGAGLDCLLALEEVGPRGWVTGVDLSYEMIQRSRENGVRRGAKNLEFRLGEAENLPVIDQTIDVVLSNCTLNLCPNKLLTFQEAFRVLKPRGRVCLSEVVAVGSLPLDARRDMNPHYPWLAGASSRMELRALLALAGFTEITIRMRWDGKELMERLAPGNGFEGFLLPALIEAAKPGV